MTHPIVGTWMLQAFHTEDVATGERSEPFGAAPRGTMMFQAEGRMAALMTPGDRLAPTTEAERAVAFQTMVACAGAYRLEPPDRFVIAVDVAWFEPWIGSEQSRTYTIVGDRMEITSAPTRLPRQGADDATVIATLVWARQGSAADSSVSGSASEGS
ncbi:lipocalin-like domain-containing protein [Lichenihabitans sp. Uapishka_5]|uniref:lipocalin-like domain-containing protein n=1 Tax=Lichenihabitans sp. Uapishka_5 TaxID=3037302 RepID=UPI0029E7F9B0|nr:lipocalin-like domain-containing protein [Lichenihabitans sp. Uapishka_5]MDX7952593.1 lipocalin-like domain-containing protein [Lichenihabitans sp. Uapishka_5]